jgi:N-acetylglucosamine-6-sulfatase
MRPIVLLLFLAACRRHPQEEPPPDTDVEDTDSDALPAGVRNVVLVITDDQRQDTLFAMPETVDRLGSTGVIFERAYVTSPMCCPSRAATLSGGFYPHHNGVLSNDPPNGGATAFVDAESLPVRLQAAGYATGLFGKYLNGYDELGTYVPPGWTSFAGLQTGGYYDWQATIGSSDADPGEGTTHVGEAYLTDWIGDQAVGFLDQHASSDPFVLVLTPLAPHNPFEPAEQDVGAYADFTWRGGAWNEADVSDKPSIVQLEASWTAGRAAEADADIRAMLETLPAVDRMIGRILDRLDALGIAEETVVVVTSDNGFLWGEHRLFNKGWAYEESVRVPLLARWPGGAVATSDLLVASDLDVAATIEEIAGLPSGGDGRSLAPILRGEPTDDWRDRLLLMNYTPGNSIWAGVVTRDWKVIVNTDGDREIYDLQADPYEQQSLHAAPPEGTEALWEWLEAERGMLMTTRYARFDPGTPGVAPLDVVAGTGPYTFRIDQGALPAGLALNETTGVIAGTPTEAGTFSARVEVTDSSVSPYHGGPERYAGKVTVQVGDPEPMMLAPPERTAGGVLVSARRAGHLDLEWSADPAFDNARRVSVPVSGPTLVPIDLPKGRIYVRLELDGVPQGSWSLHP